MSLSGGAGRINLGIKKLLQLWEASEKEWNDKVRAQYQEEYLNLLEEETRSTLRALSQLEQMILQAERECS